MAQTESYQIILDNVPDERRPDAALFLSGCFSLPPASTRNIASSGPIALITGVTRVRAEAILAELAASIPQGVELRIADAADASRISRLQWPRPPRIFGRELSEFGVSPESHDLNCPVCGGRIRIINAADGSVRAVIAGSQRRSGSATRRLVAANEKDPLFSGIKPLAGAGANYASIRALQAGDTGFWMDYGNRIFAPPAASPPAAGEDREVPDSGSSNRSGKGAGKAGAGLSAFMKPGAFALVVGRTRDGQTVKMIADIMGIGVDEARDKCMNLGLCVARDISLDEAQNLLARFRGIGARARIVRPA